MNDALRELRTRVIAWLDDAVAGGWVSPGEADAVRRVETAQAAALFEDARGRPLVVGLCGGTGVGKSSLLNRLAGQEIARTGVTRPTSHEVTVFVHESVALAELPEELPTAKVRLRRHGRDNWRDVMWVDCPDLDSVDEANRALTLAWLPHMDLLIYVVSPERYRDDVGWRVLQERKHRHGWLFVMNRWDEGAVGQADDFAAMLKESGFEEPIVARTSCRAELGAALPSPDELGKVVEALEALRAAQGAQELSNLAQRTQARALREALEPCMKNLGSAEQWRALQTKWDAIWTHAAEQIATGSAYAVQAVAARFAVREGGWLARAVQGVAGGPVANLSHSAEGSSVADRGDLDEGSRRSNSATSALPAPAVLGELTDAVWDGWTDQQVGLAADRLEVAARGALLAVEPVLAPARAAIERVRVEAAGRLDGALRRALATGGTAWQRGARRVTGFLTVVLPGLALAWIAWAAVMGFHRGSTGAAEYPGGPFAISALMLLAVAWGVPYWLDVLLRPSLERTAEGALRDELKALLADAGEAVRAELERGAEQAAQHRTRAGELLKALAGVAVRPVNLYQDAVRRVVAGLPRVMIPAGRSGATAGE